MFYIHSYNSVFSIKKPVSDPSITQSNGFFDGSPANSINFRDLEIGKSETRVIYIKNESEKDTFFCILADSEGIFKITPKQGTIPALSAGYPIR